MTDTLAAKASGPGCLGVSGEGRGHTGSHTHLRSPVCLPTPFPSWHGVLLPGFSSRSGLGGSLAPDPHPTPAALLRPTVAPPGPLTGHNSRGRRPCLSSLLSPAGLPGPFTLLLRGHSPHSHPTPGPLHSLPLSLELSPSPKEEPLAPQSRLCAPTLRCCPGLLWGRGL